MSYHPTWAAFVCIYWTLEGLNNINDISLGGFCISLTHLFISRKIPSLPTNWQMPLNTLGAVVGFYALSDMAINVSDDVFQWYYEAEYLSRFILLFLLMRNEEAVGRSILE